jgi:signal transduction histidine kinase/ligand-binding sensor domain-containing protein
MKACVKRNITFLALLAILLALFSPAHSYAQGGDEPSAGPSAPLTPPPGQDLRFEHLTSEQGLSSNRVNCVFRDSRGFMWFGTFDGLNRYDGYEFKVFRHDPSDEHSLSANLVVALYQDRDGFLWVGTSGGGLNRYDPLTEQFTHFRHDPADPNSLSSDNVFALMEDQHGYLWIGTNGGGLNRYVPVTQDGPDARFVRYQYDPDDPHSLSHNSVEYLLEDAQGTLWVGTKGGGLNRLDRDQEDGQGASFTHYRHDPEDPHSLGQDNVTVIYEDAEGSLWIGTRGGGLDKFEPETGRFSHYRHDPENPQSLGRNWVTDVYQDREGTLWVSTGGAGLNRFDGQTEDGQVGRFVRYEPDPNDPYSLSHNAIRRMYGDPSGLLWLATVGGGVNLLDLERKPFAHYRNIPGETNSLNSNDVTEIYEDRAGVLWIGTGSGGLNRLDRQTMKFSHYGYDPGVPHSISHNLVRAITEDEQGNLWLATGEGLNRFDPQTEEFSVYYSDPDDPAGLLSDSIWSVFADTDGVLWIGTANGLNRLVPRTGQFDAYSHNPGDSHSLTGNDVTVIHKDDEGLLWLGTLGDGLNRFDRETERFARYWHDPANPQSLSDNTVWAIYEDTDGVFWIGTSAGLDKLDVASGSFTHYGEEDGLPGGGVMSILEDDASPSRQAGSNLWLSTSHGLSRFDPRTETFRNYDVSDGLQGNDFVWGSALKSADGELFFGGTNGLTAFYPDQIQDSLHVSPVVLTDFQLANKPVEIGDGSVLQRAIPETEHLTLSHQDRVISFEFAALDYRTPAKNRYRYMLEGFDEGWTEVGADRRFVTYTNLDPGEYTFRVLGSNSDGVWNEEGTSLGLTITPPWWGTIWFRGLVLVVAVAGVYGAYRWRVTSLEARSRELETQVAEQTSQLDDRVKELDTLLALSQDVVSTLELEPLLSLILDELKKVVDYDVGTIRRLVSGNMELRAHRWLLPQAGQPSQRLPVADIPIMREMVQSRQAILVGDHQFNPEIVGDEELFSDSLTGDVLQANRTLMSVPLIVKGEVIGMLVLGHHQPNRWGEDEKELVQAFANQAAVAIVNAELYEQAGQTAALEERTRLARELHDSATQALYSATMFSEAGKELAAAGDLESAQHYLSRVGVAVHQALKDMRVLIFQLRPPVLEKEGLVGALQQRLNAVEKRAGIEARLITDEVPPLSEGVTDGLYHIAQEALNNALKHAEAEAVTVTIRSDGETVALEVVDDGHGFDPEAVRDGGGMGLVSMRERAANLGGDLVIDTAPGEGTRVRVSVSVGTQGSSHEYMEAAQ